MAPYRGDPGVFLPPGAGSWTPAAAPATSHYHSFTHISSSIPPPRHEHAMQALQNRHRHDIDIDIDTKKKQMHRPTKIAKSQVSRNRSRIGAPWQHADASRGVSEPELGLTRTLNILKKKTPQKNVEAAMQNRAMQQTHTHTCMQSKITKNRKQVTERV